MQLKNWCELYQLPINFHRSLQQLMFASKSSWNQNLLEPFWHLQALQGPPYAALKEVLRVFFLNFFLRLKCLILFTVTVWALNELFRKCGEWRPPFIMYYSQSLISAQFKLNFNGSDPKPFLTVHLTHWSLIFCLWSQNMTSCLLNGKVHIHSQFELLSSENACHYVLVVAFIH